MKDKTTMFDRKRNIGSDGRSTGIMADRRSFLFAAGAAGFTAAAVAVGGVTPAAAAGPFTAFTPGAVKPLGYRDENAGRGARNVGPRLSSYVPHYGDLTLTPGMQVSGKEIFGRVIGIGDSTTLMTDCIVHGLTSPINVQGASAMVGTNSAGSPRYNFGGARFEWMRIEVTNNTGFANGIDGGGYTMRYSEIYGGVDGVGANNIGAMTLENCRIAYGYYDSWWDDAANVRRTAAYTDAGGRVHNPPFPNQASGDVHADGLALQQFSGWNIRGNYVGGQRASTAGTRLDPTVAADYQQIQLKRSSADFANAAVLISSASGTAKTGGIIEKNWFEGGAARFNMAWKDYDDMSGWTIRNNRFVRSTYGYYLYIQNRAVPVLSGNVFDDNGTAVAITRWG